jgi:hypothetical protein
VMVWKISKGSKYYMVFKISFKMGDFYIDV